jgi:type I restriction enzyme, S subunit
MKISYSDYANKIEVSVLVAEAIFSVLNEKYPLKKIAEIASTTSGGTPNRSNQEYYGGNIPWLKSGELNDGVITESQEFITKEGLENSSAKLHPEGTLLLAMYGATAGKTGITNIAASTNQAVCAIFPKYGIERDYLYWFFRQHRYKFIEISKGGAQPNISQTVIKSTKIPIPEPTVQKEVVQILYSVQEKENFQIDLIPNEYRDSVSKVFYSKNNVTNIEIENTHQLDLLNKLRQQILQDAVQGKLVPQDPNEEPASHLLEKIKADKEKLIREKKIKKEKPLPEIKPEEIPFEIPESWMWCRLGELCTKITDGFHHTPKKQESGKIYISATHIRDNLIKWSECQFIPEEDHNYLFKKTYPQKGEILITNRGAGCGTPAIIDIDEEFSFQNAALIGFNQVFTNNNYVCYFLIMSRKEIMDNFVNGGLQPMLSNVMLGTLPIPIPPISEQNRIVTKIEQLLKICDELEQTVKQNQKYTQELLQVALKEALEPKEN